MRRLAAVLAMLLLAGCSDTPSDEDSATQPGVITDPRAVQESSVGEHVHDYWGGSTEKVILDASQGSGWNNLGGDYAWTRSFVPADGSIVPQGTSWLTIDVTWTDQMPTNQYGPVSLWVKPANTVEPRFVQVIEKGSTVEVPLAYEEADLPHQLLSAWEVTVQYNSSGGHNLFFGSTHVKAVAHRGLELQPFPAHPDQWGGATQLPLLDLAATFYNIGYTGTGDLPHRISLAEGAVVPANAAYVDVVFTHEGSPAGSLVLYFHGADSRQFTALTPESSDNGVHRYTIPVVPGLGDGPYNTASLWEFQVYTPSATSGQLAYYDGSYTLVATAHKGGA